MFNFFNKKRSIDSNYIVDKELENDLRKWMKSIYLEDISFISILEKLGILVDKNICLRKISNKDGLSFYYNDKNDRIDIVFPDNNRDKYRFVLSGNGYRKVYKFMYDSVKNVFWFNKERDMFLNIIDNKTYYREIDRYGFCIRIKNEDNNEIILNCSGRFDLKINNELELINYLINLDILTPVDDIYKRICEISFNNESKFFKMDITINKNNNVISSLNYSKEDLFTIFSDKREFKIKDENRDISYCRYLPKSYSFDKRNIIKIEVINNDYKFIMEVNRKCYSDISKLDNEIGLRDYLIKLEFPIKIEEVFNDICNITDLKGMDLYVKLIVYNNDEETEKLSFEYDKLKELKMIRDNKEIMYIDGLFSCISLNGNRKIYVDIIDDEVIKCGMDSNSGSGYKLNVDNSLVNLIDKEINDAYVEKSKIRKLVNNVFDRGIN